MTGDSSYRQNLFERAEAQATELLEFQPAYILSLLRSPDYASAETHLSAGTSAVATVQRRLDRQRVLQQRNRKFCFLMTEAALRWQLGSPGVMAQQMQHLLAVSQQPNVTIGIIPWAQTVSVLAGHAFHIYDRELVLIGTAHTVIQTEAPDEVERYLSLFSQLKRHAAIKADADLEIKRVMAEYLRM